MRKIGFLIIVIGVLVFTNCKSTKIVQNDSPIFKLVEASYSKIVPGEQGGVVTIKLNVFLDELAERVKFDSVLFKGNTVVPQIKKLNKNILIMVELKESKVRINNYESLGIENNEAILFYTNENKASYFYHLKDIKENPDIYQP